MSKLSTIPNEVIVNKIYFIRGNKVMLDKDLAELYGVPARRLRQQVKRNIERFPKHFMFQLTENEVEVMVSQIAIPSIQSLGGSLPYAFTEHGVLMLANVIKNERAIQMSIKIIEIFVKMREILTSHKELLLKIEQIEKKVTNQDEKVELLFKYVKQFIQSEEERPKIGYKTSNKVKVH
ncbi:MAG TPA: ORF6N domain-containing protein [Bacteroidia bacterium]|jgi:hypothetical protein|nr:ORF6N domain-containing protein [Bacteroidia bacterium]